MPPQGRSPEFLLLIERAAREPVTFTLSSERLAIKFRQRFHSFRKRLIRDAEKTSNLIAYAELSNQVESAIQREADGTCKLIFRPADWEYQQMFRDAGLTITDTPAPIPKGISEGESTPATEPTPSATIPSAVDRYLKQEDEK